MNAASDRGRVVLVTGAAGGIGGAVARQYITAGANVGVFDLDAQGVERRVAELGDGPGKCVALAGNVADPGDVQAAVQTLVDRFGGIDVVVNCAGRIRACRIEDTTPELWEDLMQVNSTGVYMASRAAVPFMRGRAGAAIVSVSSLGGLLGAPELVAYGAGKSAVLGFTRALAVELAPDNIRVNAVCPGSIDTPMPRAFEAGLPPGADAESLFWGRQLMKRFGTVDEVANVIVFLASDLASFMTGAVIPVDGGWTAW